MVALSMKKTMLYKVFRLLLISILGVINYYNFSVIYYTLHRDGNSLRNAEEFLSHLCHRMPSRTLWISDIPMGLCSRCSGIYLSLFLMLIMSFIKPNCFNIKYLYASLVLLLPLIIDGTLQLLGFYVSNNTIRLITGLLFGSSIGYLIIYFTTTKKKESL